MLSKAESEKNGSEVSTPKGLVSPTHNRSKSAEEIGFFDSKSDTTRAENIFGKNKKASKLWYWKNMPLKALNHIRNRKYNCCFYLHIHSIEGLPSNFNNLDIRVHWKRKNDATRTRPSRVSHESAKFEETLMYQCSVFGHNRSDSHHSIKYKPKIFLIYPCFVGFSDLDIGKYWIDLTKILPLNLDDLEEKKSSEKWSTSFKLTGKAIGATLNVSFGYSIMFNNNSTEECNSNIIGVNFCSKLYLGRSVAKENHVKLQRMESIPISRSINLIYQKLDEAKIGNSMDHSGNESDYIEFMIIDQELLSPKKKVRLEESPGQSFDGFAVEISMDDENINKEDLTIEEPIMDMKFLVDEIYTGEKYLSEYMEEKKANYKMTKLMLKSLSLDDVADSVANDFLTMIGLDPNNPIRFSTESYPESPRERLLRQFEKENFIFNVDENVDDVEFGRVTFSESQIWDLPKSSEFSLKTQVTNEEEKCMSPSFMRKKKGKKLEKFENEDPSCSSGAFGSIIALPFKDLSELPPLDEELISKSLNDI